MESMLSDKEKQLQEILQKQQEVHKTKGGGGGRGRGCLFNDALKTFLLLVVSGTDIFY